MNVAKEIFNAIRVGDPIIYVATPEPIQALEVIRTLSPTVQIFIYDINEGVFDLSYQQQVSDDTDPIEVFQILKTSNPEPMVLVSLVHPLIWDQPQMVQALIRASHDLKALAGKSIVLIGPENPSIPPHLSTYISMVSLPRPSEADIATILEDFIQSYGPNIIEPEEKLRAVKAAKGLTTFEVETAIAKSLLKHKRIDPQEIERAKYQMLNNSRSLKIWNPVDISQVGGLDLLKKWLQNRLPALSSPNHPHRPRGIIIAGISGTGKSLTAKAIASLAGIPLIRWDISAVKGSLVGETERNIREDLKIVDAFGQCILWIDEVEKALAGVRNSGITDSGVTADIFGTFLTWREESGKEAFVVATANDVASMPPEFFRRFDATFFVDLPTTTERLEIIRIMERRYQIEIPEQYASMTEGWTGAEIEMLARDALHDGLPEAYSAIVPLSTTMKDEIEALRKWGRTRARLASTPEKTERGLGKARGIMDL